MSPLGRLEGGNALVFEDVRDCMREVSCPAVDRL